MSLKSSVAAFFARITGSVKAEGSAFVKIAEADAKAIEAKGRIIAIDAANAAKAEVITFLTKEATRVHAASDQIKADFDAILAKL